MKYFRLGAMVLATGTALAVAGACSDGTTPSGGSSGGSSSSGGTDTPDSGVPITVDSGSKSDAASDGGVAPATYSVGGTVAGLSGTGLVLQNNGGDDIPVAANGAFNFPKKLASGGAFAVTVKTQPTAPSQTCTVSAGAGAVGSGNVTSVVVNCDANKFTVGGTVTGLTGKGLELQVNGGSNLIVNASGTFAFPAPLSSGAAYAVTVKTQPGTPSQTCAVTKGTGTVAGAPVTDVAIACTTNKYTVGGTVSGLEGTGLKLTINGGDTLPITLTGSGAFTFATPIASGTAFTVAVSAQPGGPAQTCTVAGGTGTVGSGNVTSVAVNCATNKYAIGGTGHRARAAEQCRRRSHGEHERHVCVRDAGAERRGLCGHDQDAADESEPNLRADERKRHGSGRGSE
jgi:hypothetical protein